MVEGLQELGQEDHYNGPVRIFPNHRSDSHLLYHLKLHLHLRAAVLVEELRELGQEDHHRAQEVSPLRLLTSMIDEHEKIELKMKVEKLPKIKLRSPAAATTATAFSHFSLPRLLLLVLG